MTTTTPNVRIVIDIPGEWSADRQASVSVSRGEKAVFRRIDAQNQQQITDGVWDAVQALTEFEGVDIDIPTRLSSDDKYDPSRVTTTTWSREAANEPGYVDSPYSVDVRYGVPAGEDWLDYYRCSFRVGERVYLPDYSTPGRIQKLFADATRARVQLLTDSGKRRKKKQPVVTVDVDRITSPEEFDKQRDLTTREDATAEATRLATDKTAPDGTLKKQALL